MCIAGIGMGEILALSGLAGMAGMAVLVVAAILVATIARREETRAKNTWENGG